MTNVAIKDLFRKTSEYANKEVTLEGWTKTIQKMQANSKKNLA